jgi:hypothetical protein
MSHHRRQHMAVLSMLLVFFVASACSLVAPPPPRIESSPQLVFAVVADPRSGQELWRNALSEIRDQTVNPAPVYPSAEMILVVGDIDPLKKRYADYQEIFETARSRPVFLPVMGNHDLYDREYMLDTVLPDAEFVSRRDGKYVNYTADWKNVRVIAVDGYSDLGIGGVINDEGRAWVEDAIESAPPVIDHIFVALHEPAFPRYRHPYDSFNQDADARDAFWNMLVAKNDRVRAVFVGHTHNYSRIRVADPASEEANDPNAFPDQEGGIYQVDAGAAGNLKGTFSNTIVLVRVDDEIVSYRALQAGSKDGNPYTVPFSITDEWQNEPAMELTAAGAQP